MLNILFPSKCSICERILGRKERYICSDCYPSLPIVEEPRCVRCGKPIALLSQSRCQDCERKERSSLKKGTALWVYDSRIKKAMANFKYQGCEEDAMFYAQELYRFRGEEIKRWQINAIIPVPLHRKKQWFRGYNQAQHLAIELAKFLNVPVLSDVLTRTCYTKPQKALAKRQRASNVADIFALNKKSQQSLHLYQRVLLIDDIYTTGATVEDCAKVLRKAGMQEVYFCCLCIGKDY